MRRGIMIKAIKEVSEIYRGSNVLLSCSTFLHFEQVQKFGGVEVKKGHEFWLKFQCGDPLKLCADLKERERERGNEKKRTGDSIYCLLI